MNQSTSEMCSAIITALSGNRLAAAGRIMNRTENGVRLELEPMQESGSLKIGEIFSVAIGDDILVSELLAYRSEQRGFCLLLKVLHTANARQVAGLAREYDVSALMEPRPQALVATHAVAAAAGAGSSGKTRWSLLGPKPAAKPFNGYSEAATFLLSLLPEGGFSRGRVPQHVTGFASSGLFAGKQSLSRCASP